MNTNKNLNNISILFFAFLAILVIVNLFTTNNYGRANQQVVKLLGQHDYMLNNFELHNLLASETDRLLLVDLRSEEAYNQGHLPNAVNLPFAALLDRSSIRTLRRAAEAKVVLYGASEAQAQTARVLLLAKGMDPGIKVLGGNYDTARLYAIENFNPAYAAYKDEKARFDYRRFMNAGTSAPAARESRPAGIIPVIQTTTAPAAGGC